MSKSVDNNGSPFKTIIIGDDSNQLHDAIDSVNGGGLFDITTSLNPSNDLEIGEIEIILEYDGADNTYTITYNSDNTSVASRISVISDSLINATRQELVSIAEENNIYVSPIFTADFNVRSTKLQSYTMFKSLLLLLLPIIIVSSSMSIAIDVTVGEKERRTLEAILCVPCSKWGLVIGKFLSSWLYSCVAALLSVFGYAIYFMLKDRSNISFFFDAINPLIALDVVLLSLCILSLAFLISSYARSIKEAQTYSQVLMILSTIISMFISSFSIGQVPRYLYYVPLVNNTIGVYAAVNNSFDMFRYTTQIITTIILVVITLYFSKKAMISEKQIYG
jgi:sodium transport system permease protein